MRLRSICTALIVLCSYDVCQVAMAADGQIEDVLTRTIIVRAHVIELEETEPHSMSTQHIDYVYCGRLPEGTTSFVDTSAEWSFTGGQVWPALEVEQEGIWLLRPIRDGQLYRKGIWDLGIKWPVRPEMEENYEQVRMFAEAMESVWQAKTEAERRDLLTHFVQSEVPEIAVGSILILEEGAPDALQKLVSEINLLDLPLRAQIAIDASMMKLQRDEWGISERRRQLIAGWSVRAMDDEIETMLILQRLDRAIQRKQIEPQAFFEFVRPIVSGQLRIIVKGEPYSLNIRSHALGMARWVVNEPVVRDDAFALLAGILESDEPHRLKRTAVQTMQQVTALKPEQIERLRDLRDHYAVLADKTTDRHAPVKQIAAILDEIVERLEAQDQ